MSEFQEEVGYHLVVEDFQEEVEDFQVVGADCRLVGVEVVQSL